MSIDRRVGLLHSSAGRSEFWPVRLPAETAMPETATWTIGRLLEWTTNYLRDHGSETPRLDAELLLAEACGCQRIDLYTRFAEEPTEERREKFRGLVRRRAEGMPVAYLLGRREFYSRPFLVTPDVLIPRPETEFLIIQLLDRIADRNRPVEIADLGTGSGILAVCAAGELPAARVLALDISPAALAVAQSNATAHGVTDRIEFLESDLFSAVPADRQFDFILSNPPYISTGEMSGLSRDLSYEPRLALEAGPEGTEIIRRIIREAGDRLRSGGSLLMEISPRLDRSVVALLASDGRYGAAAITKDLSGQPRVVAARRNA